MGDMDDNSLPTDVKECHRLLLAAFKQAVQLEQQTATAQQQAAQAEQRAEISYLGRIQKAAKEPRYWRAAASNRSARLNALAY